MAFCKWKKNKVWIWKACDPVSKRVVQWELGGRDDGTLKRLLDKVGVKGRIFVTDDFEAYHRCIPEDQLFTGKDLTFPIEQDNSNTRHYLARFRRKSKVTSRSLQMVDLSRLLLYHFSNPSLCSQYIAQFKTIFG